MWKFIEIGDVFAYRESDIAIKVVNIYICEGLTQIKFQYIVEGDLLATELLSNVDDFLRSFYGVTYKAVGRELELGL